MIPSKKLLKHLHATFDSYNVEPNWLLIYHQYFDQCLFGWWAFIQSL